MNRFVDQCVLPFDVDPDTATSDRAAHAPVLRRPLCGLAVLAVLSTVAFPIYMLLCGRERIVAHISDDAYYYFSVAANIAAGNGPSADGLTKTTGFHPLYAFLLAGWHRLTQPSLDGFVQQAVMVNAAALLLTGGLIYLAARRWWGATAGVAAALLWLSNPHAALVASTGLEGGVYGLTLALFLWRLISFVTADAPSTRQRMTDAVILGICGGLVVLSRTDGLALIPLAMLVMLAARPTDKNQTAALRSRTDFYPWALPLLTAAIMGAITAIFLAAWWWYCWTHTGSIVQGSAAVKAEWNAYQNAGKGNLQVAGVVLVGMGTYLVKAFLKIPALKWLASAVPLLLTLNGRPARAQRWLLHLLSVFPILLALAYALMIDRPRTWYYMPALVTLTLLTGGAAAALLSAVSLNRLQAFVRRCLPIIVWVVLIESAAIFARNTIYARSSDQAQGVRGAAWLEAHLPPGTRLGCWHSGIVQYYSPSITVINLDGLSNNDILAVLRGERTMNQYWDEMGIQGILGQPRTKMGGYQREWNGKRLSIGEAPGLQWIVPNKPE